MTTMGEQGTIILWCHPRSTSTMFERAFQQRDEFTVLHEHMGDAWYFGPERASPRFSEQDCSTKHGEYKNATYAQLWNELLEKGSQGRVFVKDMAQYIIPPAERAPTCPKLTDGDNPTFIAKDKLFAKSTIHTFLIRTPEKSVPSYYKLCGKGAETGFEYFDKNEVGLHEMRALFDYVVKSSGGKIPVVVDSDVLLAEPERVLGEYCARVGVDFQERMVKWERRVVFDKWGGWHKEAEESERIGGIEKKKDGKEEEGKNKDIQEAVEENMQDYEYMRGYTI